MAHDAPGKPWVKGRSVRYSWRHHLLIHLPHLSLCLAFCLIGFGLTGEASSENAYLFSYNAILGSELVKLECPPDATAVLCGHSMGTIASSLMAIERCKSQPDKTHYLVLVSPAIPAAPGQKFAKGDTEFEMPPVIPTENRPERCTGK